MSRENLRAKTLRSKVVKVGYFLHFHRFFEYNCRNIHCRSNFLWTVNLDPTGKHFLFGIWLRQFLAGISENQLVCLNFTSEIYKFPLLFLVLQTSPKNTFLQPFGSVFRTVQVKFNDLGCKIYTPHGFSCFLIFFLTFYWFLKLGLM